MCGIVGIYNLKKNDKPNVKLLAKMTDQLIHRGPDEEGFYSNKHIGLGHRRLSILDPKQGQQPMHSDQSNVIISYNGEVFNFIELKIELQKEGINFSTQCDTEVILKLYIKHGHSFVDYLNGQFAISIWDNKKKQLILVRDRVGICPLFYTVENNQFIFASEIKALRPALKSTLRLSYQAIDQIFTFWSPISPNTVFENIYEVQPGQMLIINQQGIQKHQYWQWEASTPENYLQKSDKELADTLHDLLVDATKIRLRSDVPVGAYLSGGLDSSVITALIHHHSNIDLQTFSLNFSTQEFDEGSYQKEMIEKIKTKHSSLVINNNDITKHLYHTIWHTESPILRTAPVPMGLLSQLVSNKDYKVVLTGEGSDEVLGGYDIFKEAKVRQFWAKSPDSGMRSQLLKKLYPYLNLPQSDQSIYLKSFFGQGLDNPNNLIFSHLPRWTTTAKAKRFFSPELISQLKHNSSDSLTAIQATLPNHLQQLAPFNRAQYIEAKSLMAGYLLNSQGDRMLTKSSIEGRFPFLDHRVIEFANQLSPNVKMKVLNEKYLLKKAMQKYLPPSIIKRHKQPYRAPDAISLRYSTMTDQLKDCISDEAINDLGFFNAKKVKMLFKKTDKVKTISNTESQTIVGILTTQILHEQFIKSPA